MDDAFRDLAVLIEDLVAERPGDIVVPIVATADAGRGALLDHATTLLEARGYHLYKVRAERETWQASYRTGRRSNAN